MGWNPSLVGEPLWLVGTHRADGPASTADDKKKSWTILCKYGLAHPAKPTHGLLASIFSRSVRSDRLLGKAADATSRKIAGNALRRPDLAFGFRNTGWPRRAKTPENV